MINRKLNSKMNLHRARAGMALSVHPYTSIYQHTQSTNAHSTNEINQFHNVYFCLLLLLQRIKTKAAIINKTVVPPPIVNNSHGDISCRITPASNIPPMRSFATSSKNFAASVFMEQRYNNYLNNKNIFKNIHNAKNQ